MLLTVEIKSFSSWVTFCGMKVIPSFMKICEVAQTLLSGHKHADGKPDMRTKYLPVQNKENLLRLSKFENQ
jgi:hypothetical protein